MAFHMKLAAPHIPSSPLAMLALSALNMDIMENTVTQQPFCTRKKAQENCRWPSSGC